MQLLITVVSVANGEPAGRRDVLVGITPTTTIGDIAAGVTDTDGGAPECRLDGRLLDPAATPAAAGLRTGATLHVGTAVPDAPHPRPHPHPRLRLYGPERHEMPRPVADPAGRPGGPEVELHVSGGPHAGRVWTLPLGTHTVGPHGAIRIDDVGAPAHDLDVCVRPDGSVLVRLPEADDIRMSEPQAPQDRAPADLPTLPEDHTPRPRPQSQSQPFASDAASGPGTGRRHTAAPEPEPQPTPDGWTIWPLGGHVVFGEFLLRVVEPTLADASVVPSADGVALDYNRPPRLIPPLGPETFRLPGPPRPSKHRDMPMLMIVAPMFFGVAMVWFYNSMFFLLFAALTPIMAVANSINGKRAGKKDHAEAVAHHRVRRASLQQDVADKIARERELRVDSGPDPAGVGLIAVGPGSRLWERRRSDPDHLVLRLGTARVESLLTIEDAAREDNHRTVRWDIPDMPVAVAMTSAGVVGIAGEVTRARSLARWMVAQAAVLHTPRDLAITVLTDDPDADTWGWLRWLPHARPPGGADGAPVTLLGNDPETVGTRVGELLGVLRSRTQANQSTMSRAVISEVDILVVLDGALRLRDVPGMVQLLKEGPPLGIRFVCVDREERLLPEECTAVVTVGATELTLRRTGRADVGAIRPDYVDARWCEHVARSLAPLRDVTPSASEGLPDHVSLLHLLDLERPRGEEIAARWDKRPSHPIVRIGAGYDGPVAFDLVRDGPHALVAGTTGAGKSELLQTFVAALAATNHPDEMTFVLVDYKGGSAFKDCVDLPHTLGMVTDLDSHLVQRALTSLTAELIRREHMLAAAGAKDLPEYRAMRGRDPMLAPMPRLAVIIDEFATLAREIEDFLPGLVGIAQRGRSLGLHLVLATQRPAGVVTNDIRANTNLRIALRVTDQMDSHDVLETSDAVSISSSTPGRALARLGHRSVVPFQTAYAGRVYVGDLDPDAPVESAPSTDPDGIAASAPDVWFSEVSWQRLGRSAGGPATEDEEPEQEEYTELKALVAAIADAARIAGHRPGPSPWLPPLESRVLITDLPTEPDARGGALAAVAWAMEDVPELQARRPLALDLDSFTHMYVLGAPRSGRTQVLRTIAGALARRHSVADVHLYGIDAAGGGLSVLAALPHCGAVAPRTDLERMDRLVTRLADELADRQEQLALHDAANLAELRTLLPADGRPAQIVLFIDGWDTVSTMFNEHDNGRLLEAVLTILREGGPAGVHIVATSERALLNGKIAALTNDRLLLRMNDRSEYVLAGVPAKRVPATMPPGRGVHAVGAVEVQVATLGPGTTGQEQAEALRAIGAQATRRESAVAPARRPFGIGVLPRAVTFAQAYEKLPVGQRRPMWGLVGIGGDDVAPVGVDFAGTDAPFVVAGPPGSGRSTVLATLAISLLASNTGIVVIAPRDSPLRRLERHPRVRVLAGADPGEDDLRDAIRDVGAPLVVLVDDSDLLAGMAQVGFALREIAGSGRDRGIGLAYAGTAEALTAPIAGWLAEARRTRKGILLNPQSVLEGDMIGTRLPSTVVRAARGPGRGHMLTATGTLITLALPDTTLDGEG